ncbi:pyrroline-5-carboxylate reductase [Aeoliella sp. ICT_H6.2]|uniref:Pyrroline-5-carboxylate reductase n=1 Tax=Aeoliella straminimaris TaxID=2954799 RepID=A0A9X2FFW4_9BACT|nr:pyrroline-5-carboxylate reductase [Aeoliella straminimaris]MCO6047513.1 pyrroline-5-carboxylate reductase [Aeoliella straminimaris]
MAKYKYGFIGAGRMATALATGLVEAQLATADEIIASDPSEAGRAAFAQQVAGCTVDADNAKVSTGSEIVVLSVKPQMMAKVLANLPKSAECTPLFVSIAAGVPLVKLETGLGSSARVVRVMPNTPCLVGRGASGYAGGNHATADDLKCVSELLEAVGIAIELPEYLLDAVTGLSGSGPAFVYTMIEAMSDGGVLAGLPRQVAHQLAVQTVLGSAQMVASTGEHPAALRDAVTSPGGTTIAGLEALEQGGLRAAVVAAVKAAANRSCELGKQ